MIDKDIVKKHALENLSIDVIFFSIIGLLTHPIMFVFIAYSIGHYLDWVRFIKKYGE